MTAEDLAEVYTPRSIYPPPEGVFSVPWVYSIVQWNAHLNTNTKIHLYTMICGLKVLCSY